MPRFAAPFEAQPVGKKQPDQFDYLMSQSLLAEIIWLNTLQEWKNLREPYYTLVDPL